MAPGTHSEQNDHFALFTSLVVVLALLSSLTLGLRLWVRAKITKNIAQDDWLLIGSHIANTAAAGIWLRSRVVSESYEPQSIELFRALVAHYWVAISFYVTAGIITKMAIAQFFLRLARRRRDKYVVLIPLGVYITALSVAMTIILFRCGIPLDAIKILRQLECPIGPKVVHPLGYMMAVLNTVCDLTFSLVPIYMLSKSHDMSRTARKSASIVIALANLGSIVSIIKIPFIKNAGLGPNSFEDGAPTFLLSVIETSVSIIAISMACLRPLLKLCRIGSSAQKSDSPDATPGGHLHSPGQVKSSFMSKIKSLNVDTKVLSGIGILPNSIVSSTTVSRSEEEPDGEGAEGAKPKMHRRNTSSKDQGIISISEVIYANREADVAQESIQPHR